MRGWGIWPAAAVLALALVACSGKDASTDGPGHIARQAGQGATAGSAAASSNGSAKHARFAALPDRGELLHYAAQAPVREGAYTWHRTELSEQHALDAIASGTLRVVSPNGRLLGFKFDRCMFNLLSKHKQFYLLFQLCHLV